MAVALPISARVRSRSCSPIRDTDKFEGALAKRSEPRCALLIRRIATDGSLSRQGIRNAWVGGSNPFRGTNKIRHFFPLSPLARSRFAQSERRLHGPGV
jgi:hypothetical protein